MAVRNRRLPQRPRLFLEPLEDRTLLTTWVPIGPAPLTNGGTAGQLTDSGRVTGVAADPGNANILYVATNGGGIWKTTNGGTQWTPLTDNLTDNNGNPLPEFMGAVAETDATSGPNNGNQIVYAGIGPANNDPSSFSGNGILVSTNGGNAWTQTTAMGAFNRNTVGKIVIDPNDKTGATAYAAVGSMDFDASTNGQNGLTGNTGIWKTTNYGQTWTNMTAAAPNNLSSTNPWTDVVVDPIQQAGKTVLYAAEGNPNGADGNGVYKSTDGGATWQLLNLLTVNGQPGNTSAEYGRISLALFDGQYQNNNVNELFVSISQTQQNGANLYKMLKSTNGGVTFDYDLTNKPVLAGYLGGQGNFDTTLAISPLNPNYIYAGGAQTNQGYDNNGKYTGVFSGSPVESFDGGDTWTDIATDRAGNGPHTDDHAVAFDASGNLIDGNDGGVFKLTNPTDKLNQRWSSLNTNLQITQFIGMGASVDPTTNNLIIYGGTQDTGTEKYTGSLGWTEVQAGDGGITRVDPNNPNNVYAEQQSLSLVVSTNGGTTFSPPITAGVQGESPKRYYPYVLDTSGNIYYGTNYLNFSKDQGQDWTPIGTPGANGFNPTPSLIHAIAVSATNNNVVYVSAGNNIFVTQNAQSAKNATVNVTWTTTTLPNGSVAGALNSIAVDPSDPTGGTAYAVVNTFTGGGKHVYYTTDFGGTWTDISGNLPDTPVWSVLVNPNNGNVYVGTDVGIYSTSKGGTSWAPFGTGLPNAQVRELVYVPGKNILVAGTFGRGAWATPLSPAPDFVITNNPTNVNNATNNQKVTFTAMAIGDPQVTVQWQVSTDNGRTFTNIPGATSLTLPITYSTALNSSQYRAEFRQDFNNGFSIEDTTTAGFTFSASFAPARAANFSRAFSPNQQTVNLSATVDDADIPTDTVNEGTVTFTVENGSTILGSVQGAVSDGTANANLTLPPALPIGNYTIAVSYSDSLGNFIDGGDASGTLTVAAAATTTQLVQASLTPNLSNMTAMESLTANVSSASAVTSGIVTFAVANQTLSANVDGNGNATVTLNVPLLNLLAPQVINVSYADPAQDLMASATTQTQAWQPINLLAPSTVTFGPNGQMVTMDLFGFLLTFNNGRLTEIDFGSNQLVFSYNASNQLTQVTLDGTDLLA